MLDKKGQALIEFVLVLPILIMLVFAMIDFGNMYMTKAELESKLNTAVELYKENPSQEYVYTQINAKENKKLEVLSTDVNANYIELVLKKEIDLITPGFNLIFGSPYKITVKRVVKK